MTQSTVLAEERDFYTKHLSDWLEDHEGKFALVKGQEIIGFYDTADNALAEGARRFGLVSFLVRRVEAAQEEVR